MKLTLTTLFTLIAFAKGLLAQNSEDVNNYISTYREAAISEMQRTGIPASIILAQGIHETEAGTSDLVKRSNNHFGIKCKDSWTGSVVYHDDDARGECFRSYNSPLDSYKDHSDFLRSGARYQSLFKLDPMNYEGWAYGLKKAGYATNSRYPQILIRLIQDYNLQQYTLIAMGKEKPPVIEEPAIVEKSKPDSTEANRETTIALPSLPPQYPSGEFSINNTRVIFAKAGTSLLAISGQYDIPLGRLMDFNELTEEDVLVKDQLLYLQRKRKTGSAVFHVVQNGENLYDICQAEGIRYETLRELNRLTNGEEPVPGEKIYLQSASPAKPVLMDPKNKQPIVAYHGIDNTNAGNAKEKETTTVNPPNSITHVVQTKETLYSISKKYGVDVEKIQQWNKLDSLSLKTGQELIIYKN
jgi:hypothetical protein